MEKQKISLFQQANQLILPETELLDFFDFLAGEKLYLPEDEAAKLEKQKMFFKFAWKTLMPVEKLKQKQDSEYKSVKIVKLDGKKTTGTVNGEGSRRQK